MQWLGRKKAIREQFGELLVRNPDYRQQYGEPMIWQARRRRVEIVADLLASATPSGRPELGLDLLREAYEAVGVVHRAAAQRLRWAFNRGLEAKALRAAAAHSGGRFRAVASALERRLEQVVTATRGPPEQRPHRDQLVAGLWAAESMRDHLGREARARAASGLFDPSAEQRLLLADERVQTLLRALYPDI